MTGIEYPVVVVEKGDISGLTLYQSYEELAYFVEEFGDCLDAFLIWDRTGRNWHGNLGENGSYFDAGIRLEAEEKPNETGLLKAVNDLAIARQSDRSFTSIRGAIEYLQSYRE